MNTKLIQFFICLLSPVLCLAQTVSGTVQDSSSAEFLAYASVYWQSNKEGVLTNDKGEFTIADSAPASDSLVVSYIGYKPLIRAKSELKKRNNELFLQSNDLQIEAVVIGSLTAEDILQKAVRLRYQNHFENESMQPGFVRSFLFYDNDLLQLSELSFNQYATINDSDSTQFMNTVRSRSVMDSVAYREINEIVNRKKDTVLLDPATFTGFGNNFALSITSDGGEGDNDKWESDYAFNGMTTYSDRSAYDITFQLHRKGDQLMKGRFLIDEETFAFLAYEYKSTNEESYNKVIPFFARAVLTLMGYHFEFTEISGKFYYRKNGNKFDLDKGISSFGMNVKKGGTWMRGNLSQEFYYLPRRASTVANPTKLSNEMTEYVTDFSNSYFDGYFHLSTTEQMHNQIAEIQNRNSNFKGSIASDRHLRWLKRQN